MKLKTLLALTCVLLACSLCAACTGTDSQGAPSPTPTPATTAATGVPTATPVSFTPGPTQTLPPDKGLEFQITPDFPSMVKDDLYIAFRGGQGQTFVRSIDVKVTKSTGEIITSTLQPLIGDDIIVTNAKGANRVEITVSLITGATYKVIDRIVEVK
jgi:hypothetical protein